MPSPRLPTLFYCQHPTPLPRNHLRQLIPIRRTDAVASPRQRHSVSDPSPWRRKPGKNPLSLVRRRKASVPFHGYFAKMYSIIAMEKNWGLPNVSSAASSSLRKRCAGQCDAASFHSWHRPWRLGFRTASSRPGTPVLLNQGHSRRRHRRPGRASVCLPRGNGRGAGANAAQSSKSARKADVMDCMLGRWGLRSAGVNIAPQRPILEHATSRRAVAHCASAAERRGVRVVEGARLESEYTR